MSFDPLVPAVSPHDEWMARVSPFLLADDPHQRCIQRARDQGISDANQTCDCPSAPCQGACCT